MKVKPLIFIAILISIGFTAIWLAPVQPPGKPQTAAAPIPDNPFVPVGTPASPTSETVQLKQKLQALEQRVNTLEKKLAKLGPEDTSKQDKDTDRENTKTQLGTRLSASELLNKSNLVAAGVNPVLAENILNRMSELEYRRLELRDRAIREKYIGSRRYNQELQQLNKDAVDLRKAIGDNAYDRYLYETHQVNRVKVNSIMKGSPAELAGMQPGDVIINYAGNRIFGWHEIREATSEGALGDYVTVNILRNGEPMSLMLPRGPLGVRLDTVLGNPDAVTQP